MTSFKLGQKVVHKAGGQEMVVVSTNPEISCAWMVNHQRYEATFTEHELEDAVERSNRNLASIGAAFGGNRFKNF